MAETTLKGEVVKLEGSFLKPKDLAPDFALCSTDLTSKTLQSFTGKTKVIATVPSLDTEVCSMESKEIDKLAIQYPSILFIIVSKDLPFAQKRFCKEAHLNNIIPLSDIRSKSNFARNYGVLIKSGPLDGLLARGIVLLDSSDKVIYSELTAKIETAPNFIQLKSALERM